MCGVCVCVVVMKWEHRWHSHVLSLSSLCSSVSLHKSLWHSVGGMPIIICWFSSVYYDYYFSLSLFYLFLTLCIFLLCFIPEI